jgi:hypothetical protein
MSDRNGCVPGDDGELVGEVVELSAPLSAVGDSTVQQDERRAFASLIVSDAEVADLDPIHLT